MEYSCKQLLLKISITVFCLSHLAASILCVFVSKHKAVYTPPLLFPLLLLVIELNVLLLADRVDVVDDVATELKLAFDTNDV